MHWLDTIILGIVGFGALWGAFTGLLWQVARIVTVASAVYCTVVFNDLATPLVRRYLLPNAPELIPQITAYVIVFLLVCVVMLALTSAVQRAIRKIDLQWLNRLLGAGFGAVQALVVLGIILFGLANYAGPREMMQESQLGKVLLEGMKSGVALLPEEYRNKMTKHEGRSTKE